MEPFIETRGVSKFFSGVRVLTDVSLSFRSGEVHGLIGENGAGKSTLIKIFSGIYRPEKGTLLMKGAPVSIRSPSHAAELGVGVIHQEFDLIPQMTAAQNMYLGREPAGRFGIVDFAALHANARRLLDEVRLSIEPDTPVRALSVEQKQLLAIAKALSREAGLLIMDEPTAALNGTEIDRLLDIVRSLRESGRGVIFISHHMEEVLEISDRVTVLRDGRVIATRPSSEMSESEAVRMMTGKEKIQKRLRGGLKKEDFKEGFPETPAVLSVKNLSHPKYFHDVSFSLRKGEIVGMVGLEGQGQRQILRALYGDLRASGEVRIDGAPAELRSPSDALKRGVVFVPEERKEEGLCLQLDIEQNLTLSTLGERSVAGVLKLGRAARENVLRRMSDVKLSTDDPARIVNSLSGGNQQKVVIAKCLARKPTILLFSEPTRGIDVGAKEDIYLLIRALADGGSGIVVVSGDISELLLVCDRILVIHAGRIAEEFDTEAFEAGNADRERIMRAMWGLGAEEIA
ncbi:MAG: sugar ABC transporter ATP-binding protein [Synergistaceae bacterium]|jgi:ABC-type sugar transport system ATPase subunit|nr:sugar ABC transporter ATP-binding protein [Synergistaceae bacterium]